jgi:hypothetical protein
MALIGAALTSLPAQVASWVILAFLTLAAGTIIGLIWRNKIDLTRLISEPTGDASMSRFQLLIFTFVIAAAFFLITVNEGEFKEIPSTVLGLLGISAGSYVVSKGIQFSKDAGVHDTTTVSISPSTATVSAGNSVIFKADLAGLPDGTMVTWSLEPATGMGTIAALGTTAALSKSATYAAPLPTAAVKGTVTVRATADGQTPVTDIATVALL